MIKLGGADARTRAEMRRGLAIAKLPGKPTPGLEHFRPYLEASLLAR
jgi:hypothetical protein